MRTTHAEYALYLIACNLPFSFSDFVFLAITFWGLVAVFRRLSTPELVDVCIHHTRKKKKQSKEMDHGFSKGYPKIYMNKDKVDILQAKNRTTGKNKYKVKAAEENLSQKAMLY